MKPTEPRFKVLNPPVPEAIEEAAAEWLARRNGGLSAIAAAELQAWLQADPRHAASFAEMERALARVSFTADQAQAEEVLWRLDERERRRATRRASILSLAGLAAAAALLIAFLPTRVSPPSVPTVTVRPDRQVLPDGSTVELNAATQIAVEFTEDVRGVRLLKGEALFTVAKDPAHPFVVSAGGIKVKAVGTAFSVRFDPKKVDVLVTDGTVAIQHPLNPAADQQRGIPVEFSAPRLVPAGNRLSVPVEEIVPIGLPSAQVSPTEIAKALAWRGKRMEFTRTPLAEAVELFNRQNQVQLKIQDSAGLNVKISGIFWADDPEGFVRLLVSGFKVQVSRVGDSIVLRAK